MGAANSCINGRGAVSPHDMNPEIKGRIAPLNGAILPIGSGVGREEEPPSPGGDGGGGSIF